MAKFFLNEKWKKRSVTALAAALSLSLSLGIFTACSTQPEDEDDEEDETSVTEQDNSVIENGNFEFYSGKDTDLDEKRTLIYTPTAWSFSSGSPTSETRSGIINTEEWDYLTKEGRKFESVDDAVAHWNDEGVTAYDRFKFYEDFKTEITEAKKDANSEAAKLFNKYNYSNDYEDVENLRKDLGETLLTHDGDEENNGMLMIHNSRISDSVVGTAQYYTSSTTVTLKAGTAAEVSVWVKTAALEHFYSSSPQPVTKDAGAYIGVTHTVGGKTLDQMQIKNINTKGVEDNNGWTQYTLYVKASTFATSTFKIVLGLGMGDNNDRFEQVNGYALFDDLTCEIITAADYDGKVEGNANVYECGIDSLAEDKIIDVNKTDNKAFALNLYAGFESVNLTLSEDIGLTTETSGNRTSESLVPDNRNDSITPADKKSIAALTSYSALKDSGNGYLANILKNDFEKDGSPLFPFADNENGDLILLLSTNGAAYTAKVNGATKDGGSDNQFVVSAESRMLVSFFVKTSTIRTGKTGATVTLVDGENKTSIAAFDSHSVATVDINDEQKDIYNGWVQCFFFVENNTKDELSFSLEFSYGPTSVDGSKLTAYDDGYAAFANFEVKELSKTQYGYISTGTYAKTVSLTGRVKNNSTFDSAAATSDIETSLATPVSFKGVASGSEKLVENGNVNPTPSQLVDDWKLYTGLLNAEYAENYMTANTDWSNSLNGLANGATEPEKWWANIFGDEKMQGRVANQPLVLMNASDKELPAYGFFYSSSTTVGANAYQKIFMRVKLSAGMTAEFYLIDTSDVKAGFNNPLTPAMPKVTYWYDNDGNICTKDPTSSEFKKHRDVAYYLEENGLYTKADSSDGKYYANFANYNKDGDGNYVTATDEKIAYYFHDGEYFAYYDKKTNVYSQPVEALPTTGDIVRYLAPTDMSNYASKITLTGTAETENTWTEIAFYVHTGSKAKDYRLEIWAGARDCEVDKDYNVTSAGKGIPSGGYIFFDAYSSSSTNFDTLLSDWVQEAKDDYNKENNLSAGQPGYLGEDDDLPVGKALYSTFSFYDSPDYLRYDKTQDEEGLGNPYGSYKQSEYSQKLVWFTYENSEGLQPVKAYFVDYSANDVAVTEDDLGNNTDEETPEEEGDSNTNIWLLLSSCVLAAALVFAIGAVAVRRILKNKRASAQPKAAKEKKPKLKVVKSDETEPVETKKSEEPASDENDPYND